MALAEARMRDDDGDAAYMLGIAEAELYANGELPANIQVVNRGLNQYVQGRRHAIVPDMGYLTLRGAMPPRFPLHTSSHN